MSEAGEPLEGVAEDCGGVCARMRAKMTQGLGSVFNSGGDVEKVGGAVEEGVFEVGVFLSVL